MKKKSSIWLPALLLAVFLTGCQQNSLDPSGEEQTSGSDTVNLTVWGAEEDEELLRQIIDGFETEYQEQADFQITYEPQSESHCTDALMADLENGADVFAFADDQLNTLVAAGALEPIENADTVRKSTTPVQALKHCEWLLRRLSQHLTFSLAPLPQKRGMEASLSLPLHIIIHTQLSFRHIISI